MTRKIVRLEFLIFGVNDLYISAYDIGNAYLNATCWEKMWTEVGPEFGSDKVYVFLIIKYLYGLKSSGASWRSKLAKTINSMGYRSTDSEPDVWIKRATPDNGTAYCK